MSYKTITVCLDDGANTVNIIDSSLELALTHNAHVTGLHISYITSIPYDCCAEGVALKYELDEMQAKKEKAAQEAFTLKANLAGVNFDWLNFATYDLRNIAASTRVSDLVVINQYNPKDSNSNQVAHFTGRLVLQLGRPLLILPRAGEFKTKFDNILIAWDSRREATRAVTDALPFLQQAKSVNVLTIKKGKSEFPLPNLGIGEYLARHGIEAEIYEEESLLPDSADWLLLRAKDLGSDLIVMGAYGHDRYSELVFGGMTQKLLCEAYLPVLMSH